MLKSTLSELIKKWVPDRQTQESVNSHTALVTGLTVSKEGRLILDCLMEEPCDPQLICQLEEALEKALAIHEVMISQRFAKALDAHESSRYAASMAPWLLRHIGKRDVLMASMLRQASFVADLETSQVQVKLHTVCCDLLEKSHIDHLSAMFCQHIAAETSFYLKPERGDLSHYTKELDRHAYQHANQTHASLVAERPPLPDSPASSNGFGASSGTLPSASSAATAGTPEKKTYRRKPQPEGVFYGRMNTDLSLSQISELNSESGMVHIEGQVIDYESRLVSQGTRILIKFALTDFTSSVTCILFAKLEEEEALAAQLKKAWIRVHAQMSFDSQFAKDLQAKVLGLQKAKAPDGRKDTALEKRIELHAHTKMSTKDAVCDASQLVSLAASFGHQAVAITDHGVVQSFPEAAETRAELARDGKPIKLIYGVEGYLVDDGPSVTWQTDEASLSEGFIALDVETTGLDPAIDRLIEVAAVRFKPDGQGGFIADESKTSLVNPGIPVTPRSQELTGISTDMIKDAPEPLVFLSELADWMGALPVVAHNAFFDLSFLRYEGFRTAQTNDPRLKFNPPLIDTLALSRAMLPDLKNHKLNTVCAHLAVTLDNHHRAEADAKACGEIFARLWQKSQAKTLSELNFQSGHQTDEEILAHRRPVYHIILLAADALGLYNLYRLISLSHTKYFHSRPRIPRGLLQYFRSGLLIGSACESGELFQSVYEHYKAYESDYDQAVSGLGRKELLQMARFYDYLEIQPVTNNRFMLRQPDSGLRDEEDLRNLNRLIVKLAAKARKPVCATCDVHFLEPGDRTLREILMTDMGFSDASEQPGLYYRTTSEMLDEFSYLGQETAKAVVVDGPLGIAARISEDLRPFPAGSFPPIIETAADDIRSLTKETAFNLYGRAGQLPALVEERMNHELSAIIDNGFAIMYYIAHKLVKKSNDDGYIVGSRGSVGSSVVAAFCGISEVNPLPPHYVCPQCRYSEFDQSGKYGSGYDLPPKNCPDCQTPLVREGQDIPFETFLGFEGDKVPDIDLNFSGEYQPIAHKFIETMFGSQYTFRAGTIGAFAEKNAQAMVRNYFEEKSAFATQAEIGRLSSGLIGVKRTTGQHPGGIVVVPKEREIYDFTPIQHPADKRDGGTITTHFDFNAMHDTILKLDILGHDDPTMLKMLSDLTGVNVLDIPIPDEKVMSLFKSTEALGIPDGTSPAGAATLGLPEMGTFMARDMIKEANPACFYDLVQLSGLSHGTDVWKGNAQELIRSGICTINDVIGCRDSIMTTLIYKGLEPKEAFAIMEKVRKGRGLSPEHEQLMRDHDVPDWYIESCRKIRYMFPKAHAAAYTISSLRIAWFKVHRPVEYYCAYFTVRADEFDSSLMVQPPQQVKVNRENLRARFREATDREQKIYYILELVEEMQLRGIEFLPINLYQSAASTFLKISDTAIQPPLDAIPSISPAIAENIVRARESGPFKSKDELMRRAGIGQSAVETLTAAGCLDGMPDSAQMDIFEWIS